MSVFVYQDSISESTKLFKIGEGQAEDVTLYKTTCPYCLKACYLDDYEMDHPESNNFQYLAVCGRCGWWSYESHTSFDGYLQSTASAAILKKFAVDDSEVPCVELAKYIERHHEKLVDIAPAKCEELVASVYRDVFGYRVESCSYARPDRGIDVVCVRRDSGDTVAIQVKRYRAPIKLGYIHQFFGAMFEAGHRNGIFVTTGRFQRGCYGVSASLRRKSGVEIQLVDGRRFLEFLGLLNKRNNKVYCPVWGCFPLTFNDPGRPKPSQEELRWLTVPPQYAG